MSDRVLTRRFSPCERKALEFAESKHEGQKRIGGADYIEHPIGVAKYLYDHGYRGKYVFTAFCHDLLEDTDATEEEIFSICGRFTRDAVKSLTKREGLKTEEYLEQIKKDEVAYPVKVADRIMNLLDSVKADLFFRERYVKETEDYYLDFAVDSPFYEGLRSILKTIKVLNHKERNLVNIEDIEVFPLHEEYFVMLGYVYTEEPITLSCIICEDPITDISHVESSYFELYAFPNSKTSLYSDEKEYYDSGDTVFRHESIASCLNSVGTEQDSFPSPDVFLNGVVQDVMTSDRPDDVIEDDSYLIFLDLLGMTIAITIACDEIDEPKPGNILSGIFTMYARL